MKKIIVLALIVFTAWTAQAQSHFVKDAAKEEKAIKAAVLQYIENFFENKYEPMAEVLHPRLAKRGMSYGRSGEQKLSDEFGPAALKKLMASKQPFPKKYQKNKVKVLEIFRNQASVRLVTGYPRVRWVEYMHLAKLDGKWMIMNVFYDYFPRKKTRKEKE